MQHMAFCGNGALDLFFSNTKVDSSTLKAVETFIRQNITMTYGKTEVIWVDRWTNYALSECKRINATYAFYSHEALRSRMKSKYCFRSLTIAALVKQFLPVF